MKLLPGTLQNLPCIPLTSPTFNQVTGLGVQAFSSHSFSSKACGFGFLTSLSASKPSHSEGYNPSSPITIHSSCRQVQPLANPFSQWQTNRKPTPEPLRGFSLALVESSLMSLNRPPPFTNLCRGWGGTTQTSLLSLPGLSRTFPPSLSLKLFALNFSVMLHGQPLIVVSSSLGESFNVKNTYIVFPKAIVYQLSEDPIFLQWPKQ